MRSYSIPDPGSMVIMTAIRPVPPRPRNLFRVADIPTLTLAELRSARQRIAEVLLRIDARVAALEGLAASDRPPAAKSPSAPLSERVEAARAALTGSPSEDVRQRAAEARQGIAPSSAPEAVRSRARAIREAMRP